MGEFSLTHILLVAFVFLLFFGPSKLPQLGASLGKAIRGFKSGLSEIDGEARNLPPKDESTESLQHESKSAQKSSEPVNQNKKNS